MATNRLVSVVVLSLTVFALAGAAWAQPSPSGRPTAPPPDGGRMPPDGRFGPGMTPPPGYNPSSQPAVPVTVSGEYEEISRLFKLTAAQQKGIENIIRDEQKALANFDKENKKGLDELNKNLDAMNKRLSDPNRFSLDANNARATLLHRIELLGAARDRIAHLFKARAAGVLTTEQRATWIGVKLNHVLSDELMPVGLSAEQQASVKAICEQSGKTATSADVEADQALMDSVRQQVSGSVLNDQQRTRYSEVLRERQARKAT